MAAVRGHNLKLINYTPGAARKIIIEAFQRDIARQRSELCAKVGIIGGVMVQDAARGL